MRFGNLVPLHSVEWDGDFKDWINMLIGTFWESKRYRGAAEQFWGHKHVLLSVSCRTILDLYLQAVNLPADSEVLMSAVNIPDMQRIVEAHNLKVIPVEVQWKTMGIDLNDLESKITDKTKLIIVAHIFGRINDLTPVLEIAQRHKLLVIEDAAEGFSGQEYRGHHKCDLSLFSFGQIKFNTACGGGIGLINNEHIYKLIIDTQNTYRIQSRSTYLWKLFVAFLFQILQSRFVCRLLVLLVMLGLDYRPLVLGKLRGFPSTCDDFLTKFRWKPSNGLLRALDYRLGSFSQAKFSKTETKKMKFIDQAKKLVLFPGLDATRKFGFWLCPLLPPKSITPSMTVSLYSSCGIEASLSTCQLGAIQPHNLCPKSHELMSKLIFLPINRNANKRDLDRILSVTGSIYSKFD